MFEPIPRRAIGTSCRAACARTEARPSSVRTLQNQRATPPIFRVVCGASGSSERTTPSSEDSAMVIRPRARARRDPAVGMRPAHRQDIVDDDAQTSGKVLQPPDRPRLPDVEEAEPRKEAIQAPAAAPPDGYAKKGTAAEASRARRPHRSRCTRVLCVEQSSGAGCERNSAAVTTRADINSPNPRGHTPPLRVSVPRRTMPRRAREPNRRPRRRPGETRRRDRWTTVPRDPDEARLAADPLTTRRTGKKMLTVLIGSSSRLKCERETVRPHTPWRNYNRAPRMHRDVRAASPPARHPPTRREFENQKGGVMSSVKTTRMARRRDGADPIERQFGKGDHAHGGQTETSSPSSTGSLSVDAALASAASNGVGSSNLRPVVGKEDRRSR